MHHPGFTQADYTKLLENVMVADKSKQCVRRREYGFTTVTFQRPFDLRCIMVWQLHTHVINARERGPKNRTNSLGKK